MAKQRVLKGFSFRHPSGELDWRVFDNVENAQSQAAFASERPYSHTEMPNDWHRAYKQGFRVVSVELKAGRSRSEWRKPYPEKD